MKQIGLFEAKTRLSELCQEVSEGGEEILITRRGKPWVRLLAWKEGGKAPDVWEEREQRMKKKGLGKKTIPLPGGVEENPPIWKS